MFYTLLLNEASLTQEGIKQLTSTILDQSNEEPDPMLRYAMARSTEQAFSEAKKSISAEATLFALANLPQAQNGSKFEYEGHDFMVQRTPQYQFASKRSWTTLNRKVEEAQRVLDAAKAALKAEEKALIITGKVEQLPDKITFKFLPR